ncbi:unnamed protein product [Peronospora destructor]|uniref:A to I editase domain-containing protein n=1 Tax=Peronospora destructor TaxID=86335 RepID=A0AAV0V1H0_9STRA|nr:unnamed protein product [Peronospora destructor]
MPSPAIESDVAHAVLQWFDNSSQCQKKIPISEWTVLAGIVLQTRSPPSSTPQVVPTDTFRVLTAATGNKCLGRRDLNANGLVVNDCHAEVLARRALLRYLYIEALLCKENKPESNEQSIFEYHSTSRRLVLKPQHSLHLFISEAPCGDAAIYELRQEVVDQLVQQRTAGCNTTDDETGNQVPYRSELRVTGAKRPRHRDTLLPDKRFTQTAGVARVKSGRSDLPLDKQTLSMSCSDKLAKWNALGLQGSLLLQWFEPVFLSSICVSRDDKAMSVVKQERALRRAVCTRLKERGALTKRAQLSSCNVHVLSDVVSDVCPFSRRRTCNRTPSSLALVWTTQESFWTRGEKQKPTPESMNEAEFAREFFHSFEIEFLMAATGFKQGAKKASKMDQAAMERVASRLSKRNLLRAFHHVLGRKLLSNTDYLQLKQNVPLDVPLPAAPSTQSVPTAVIASNDRRKQFFVAFSDWIGVPTTFKQFKL